MVQISNIKIVKTYVDIDIAKSTVFFFKMAY